VCNVSNQPQHEQGDGAPRTEHLRSIARECGWSRDDVDNLGREVHYTLDHHMALFEARVGRIERRDLTERFPLNGVDWTLSMRFGEVPQASLDAIGVDWHEVFVFDADTRAWRPWSLSDLPRVSPGPWTGSPLEPEGTAWSAPFLEACERLRLNDVAGAATLAHLCVLGLQALRLVQGAGVSRSIFCKSAPLTGRYVVKMSGEAVTEHGVREAFLVPVGHRRAAQGGPLVTFTQEPNGPWTVLGLAWAQMASFCGDLHGSRQTAAIAAAVDLLSRGDAGPVSWSS
jgi:hypothetical protein